MKPSLCSKRRVKIKTKNQKSGARLINQGFFEPSTTLQLNEDTIVTQTAATKYQKTVLDYTGANDAAVEEKFRQLTGLTGPLDEAKVYEGSDGIVYTVEMPNQTVTLRTVSSSGKDWTIDLKNPLSNCVKRIKFSR